MSIETLMPSAELLQLLDRQAVSLEAQAEHHTTADRGHRADLGRMTTEQQADIAALVQLQAQVDALNAAVADRRQRIEATEQQADQHAARAQQYKADAEYLRNQLGAAPTSGAPEVTGPQPAVPVTPAEMAAQLATSGDAPECLTCHAPIREDALGWMHTANGTAYCYEGSGASVIRVPAALEVSRVIA